MKRILVFIQGYEPAFRHGGPPVSIKNLCDALHTYFNFYIITGDHDSGQKQKLEAIHDGWNERGNCKVLYLSDRRQSYRMYWKIVKEVKPDMIYLQSIFDGTQTLPALRIAQKLKIPAMLAIRGQLYAGAMNVHNSYKKQVYLWVLRIFGLLKTVQYQSTSDEETDSIKRLLRADESKIHRLNNLVVLPTVTQTRKKRSRSAKFVFISRIVPKKRLHMAIDAVQALQGDVALDIYGFIEDQGYWTECKGHMEALPSNIHIQYCGALKHDQVSEVFMDHDAFLFPTAGENFGHVIAESLLACCPVFTSMDTPWTDMNDTSCGWALNFNDENSVTTTLQNFVDMNDDEYTKITSRIPDYVKRKLDYQESVLAYIKVFKSIMG